MVPGGDGGGWHFFYYFFYQLRTCVAGIVRRIFCVSFVSLANIEVTRNELLDNPLQQILYMKLFLTTEHTYNKQHDLLRHKGSHQSRKKKCNNY